MKPLDLCSVLSFFLFFNTVIYKRIGDEVVLKPAPPPASPITHVLWKQSDDLAVEWEGDDPDQYSHFRGLLSHAYSRVIYKQRCSIQAKLKSSPVPKPRIDVSCNEEKTRCTLTCDENGQAMDPKPTYIWKFNASEMRRSDNGFEITPTSAKDFICELENPVSRESSQAMDDPFYQGSLYQHFFFSFRLNNKMR
uniref:Ig-like domain-containing protein n=1 Tax=Neogobius melanostomus TaxID=47308 RepID=A0A8C6WWC4_9GOBI